MSISGDKPFIPEDPIKKSKHTGIRPIEEKSKDRSVDDLKTRIKDDYQVDNLDKKIRAYPKGAEKSSPPTRPLPAIPVVAKKTLSPSSKNSELSKKSKGDKPIQFEERARNRGFEFNKNLQMYQLISNKEKLISIEEMEHLANESDFEIVEKDPSIAPSKKHAPDKKMDLDKVFPLELFEKILSNLDPKEIPLPVSKSWDNKTLGMVKKKEMLLLGPFIKFLTQNIDAKKYSYITSNLNDPFITKKISESKNLLEFQSEMLDLRDKIALEFTKLNHFDFKKLKELSFSYEKPLFFDKLFDLVPVYNEMIHFVVDQANIEDYLVTFYLRNIILNLSLLGCFSKSIAFLDEINISKELKSNCLSIIIIKMAEAGKFDEAIKLAKTIPNKFEEALKDISIEFCKSKNFYSAIQLALTIKDVEVRTLALSNISKYLAEDGKFDHATAIALFINVDDQMRTQTLRSILDEMIKSEKVDERALELLDKIPDFYVDEELITSLSFELAKSGNPIEAFKLLKKIPSESELDDKFIIKEAIRDIATELINLGKSTEASNFLDNITNEFSGNSLNLQDISFSLAKLGKVDEAIKLLEKFKNDEQWWHAESKRKDAIERISLDLARLGKFDDAIKFANALNDKAYKTDKKNILMQIENIRKRG